MFLSHVTHCLQINRACLRLAAWRERGRRIAARSGASFIQSPTITSTNSLAFTMPCRKENYIFLEQSVTVGSKEVDALVTRIGEALQLHNNSGGHPKKTACLHEITTNVGSVINPAGVVVVGGGGVGGTTAAGAPVPKRQGCCMRLRNRGSSRASPYHIPGSSDQEWDQFKPWNKKRLHAEEDDPHRLLQELILSGNLIKEAVRRLQFSTADCGDFPKAADNVQC